MSGQRSQRTNDKLIFVPPGFGVGGGFPTLPVTLFVTSSSLLGECAVSSGLQHHVFSFFLSLLVSNVKCLDLLSNEWNV